MNRLLTEYLLKGVFLGLLVFAALQLPPLPAETGADQLVQWRTAAWTKFGVLAAFLMGGLSVALLLSLMAWLPRGIRIGGRFLSLLLFLLLESPTLIYVGLVGGVLAGALWVKNPHLSESLLPICVGGGALIGVAIGEARRIGSANARSMAAAAVACILVGVAIYYVEGHPIYNQEVDSPLRVQFGIHLLLGLPFFYLLTFAGRAEETEAEFAALCAGFAVSVWMINLTPQLPSLALILPAGIYVVYTRNVMPGLRVFKHTLRGYSYSHMGKTRAALQSFRRALALDNSNQLALAGLTRVHASIDPREVAGDSETLALIDLDLCLNRAGRLLWEKDPTTEHLDEVNQLLELVESQRPQRRAEVEYWRAVADMRRRNPSAAAERLALVLEPGAWSDEEQNSRDAVLFPAWQMALLRSQELAARVGKPMLARVGRRMEAIAAAERMLSANPDHADAGEFKRVLYDGLTKSEYDARRPVVETEFDAGYARELGLALLGDAARWRRGIEFLRMAADARPAEAPGLFQQIAQAFERAGEQHEAHQAREEMRRSGLAFGPNNLTADEQTIFYTTVKRLADEAAARGEQRAAIELLRIIVEGDRAGLQTFRQLAEMHEQLGEAMPASHYNDLALVYSSKDPELLQRKDRYYYSVVPAELKDAPEVIRKGFDTEYCLNKARQIFSGRNLDVDAVDWGHHLAELAAVMKPEWIEPKLITARALLWKGERDQALKILEDIREAKPAKFAASSEEDAWFRTNQLLGDLYLNEFARPDLAVPCFQEFRQSAKSGADTLFKLGQAYEQLGDPARAVRYYEQVTGYTEHPRYYDAQAALTRLRQGTG